MTTETTARDGFVTRRLLALSALIFALNLPTIGVWGTPTAQAAAALLYLAGALAIASFAKAVIIIYRHGIGRLTA